MFRLFILLLLGCVSCNNNKQKIDLPVLNSESVAEIIINDTILVRDWNYKYGDVRRYGFTERNLKKPQIDSIIAIASRGIPIIFPDGVSLTNLEILNTSDLEFYFNSGIISGRLSVRNSNNISIKGDITILDILFLRDVSNIVFENVTLRTNKTMNNNKKANRGVSIYSGSKDVFIDDLRIFNSGGNGEFFQYNQCAFMIHGFLNTPKNIMIRNLLIQNSLRTAVYISGEDHSFEKIEIVNYGLSNDKSIIKQVEKASKGEETLFNGIWMNHTQNNLIDTLLIDNSEGKGDFSIVFDESSGTLPSIINNIHISDANGNKIHPGSNIIVLNEIF